jgi:hypothetical protein
MGRATRSTLNLSFVDGNVDNLQAATDPSSVPAPETLWLLGPAVLMMAVSACSSSSARRAKKSRRGVSGPLFPPCFTRRS